MTPATAPTRRAAADAGFTLIELLVALGLFAVVAAAATGLLTTVAAARRQGAARLARLAAIERALVAIDRDLSAIADAPLQGGPDGVRFDRWREGGATTLGYRLEGGDLVRRDGGRRQRLLDDVAAVRWRYLGAAWQDRWPADAAQGRRWPAAVAVDLTLAKPPMQRLQRLVDLPERPLPAGAVPP